MQGQLRVRQRCRRVPRVSQVHLLLPAEQRRSRWTPRVQLLLLVLCGAGALAWEVLLCLRELRTMQQHVQALISFRVHQQWDAVPLGAWCRLPIRLWSRAGQLPQETIRGAAHVSCLSDGRLLVVGALDEPEPWHHLQHAVWA
jgi:hypothetical protein